MQERGNKGKSTQREDCRKGERKEKYCRFLKWLGWKAAKGKMADAEIREIGKKREVHWKKYVGKKRNRQMKNGIGRCGKIRNQKIKMKDNAEEKGRRKRS